ncbi:MAG TPA: hypothetical protein VHB23_15135 [Devosiaceae bacterium]|jgi:hypothetical protein|nr:hypothetical protein [Devosiaceae bacterium]
MLDASPLPEPLPASDAPPPCPAARSCLDGAEARAFASRLTSAFRRHPHINNVMTHIASGRWEQIERALAALLAAPIDAPLPSPLARNIHELLWAEAGVTGRILKPLFIAFCRGQLPPDRAERCLEGIATLAAVRAGGRPRRQQGV